MQGRLAEVACRLAEIRRIPEWMQAPIGMGGSLWWIQRGHVWTKGRRRDLVETA